MTPLPSMTFKIYVQYAKIQKKSGDNSMIKHPDGLNMTSDMISIAGIKPGSAVLDAGAGDGETVRYLLESGYSSIGIDLIENEYVQYGDITSMPFSNAQFDAVIAECSISVCKNASSAFSEILRVLKPFGILMISDVYFKSADAPFLSLPCPANKDGWHTLFTSFEIIDFTDKTSEWSEYIVNCVWHGIDIGDCGFLKTSRGKKPGYFAAVLRKRALQ